jgi:hypothetical protein
MTADPRPAEVVVDASQFGTDVVSAMRNASATAALRIKRVELRLVLFTSQPA